MEEPITPLDVLNRILTKPPVALVESFAVLPSGAPNVIEVNGEPFPYLLSAEHPVEYTSDDFDVFGFLTVTLLVAPLNGPLSQ